MSETRDACPVPSNNIFPAGRESEVWNDEHFSQLRKDAGVPDDFLNAGWTYEDFKEGGGKGGTLMAHLWGKYIVKELSKGDHKTLLEVTPSYSEHLQSGKSMLCAVFLHFKDVRSERNFFAMRNEVGIGPFSALYDLKGCADDKMLVLNGDSIPAVHKRIWNVPMWCCRCTWSERRQRFWQGKEAAAHLKLRMSSEQRTDLLKQIKYDVEWLASHRLMDYSLLVALKSEPPSSGSFLHVIGDVEDTVLNIGIIDFLQKWGCGKRIARAVKILECNKATIPPILYARRFLDNFEACFVSNELVTQLGNESGIKLPNSKSNLSSNGDKRTAAAERDICNERNLLKSFAI